MIKFHTIGQVEHGDYPFEDLVTKNATKNGALGDEGTSGDVGKFVVGATKTKAIMQLENGDDAGMDEYTIPAGSHVRIGDLTKIGTFEVYGFPLPSTYEKGDKMVSTATGQFEVPGTAPTAAYFLVDEVITSVGQKVGALVTYTA